eukprot:6195747-Pleurochrysis_carterae.AAC.2
MLIQQSLLNLIIYRVAGAASPGKELSAFDTFWELGRELSPFKVDNDSAVDFLLAVLDSPARTVAKQSAVDQATARQSGCACVRTRELQKYRLPEQFSVAKRSCEVRVGRLDRLIQLNHARLMSWRAIQFCLLILYEGSTRASVRGRGQEPTIIHNPSGSWGASAGAGPGRLGGGSGKGAIVTGRRRPSRASLRSGNFGSGVRALRKYACDASVKWQTVHVSVKPQ